MFNDGFLKIILKERTVLHSGRFLSVGVFAFGVGDVNGDRTWVHVIVRVRVGSENGI